MRYVAAYLLASLGEEGAPSKEKIVSILDSVGIDVDDNKLDKVFPDSFSLWQSVHVLCYVARLCPSWMGRTSTRSSLREWRS